MTTAINKYIELRNSTEECIEWASMIGREYRGGGGGIGRLNSLSLMKGESSPTVYFQESNGSTNYHRMPSELSKHLEAAIIAKFGELIAEALKRQESELKDCANAAVKEHKKLLEAAGIDTSECPAT